MRRLSLFAAVLVLAAAPALAQAPKAPARKGEAAPNYSTVPPVIPNEVFRVEQLVTGKLPAQLLQQLQPLKTLGQVEALLRANSIPYMWRKAELNSAMVPPEAMQQIRRLPPGEVFVIPSGNNLTISVIIGRP